MNKATFLLAAALVSLAGCAGYQPGVSKPHKLAHVSKLAVPTFENDTLAPRLEVLVTNAVIKQLQVNGSYQIVPVSEADAVLRGTISEITSHQARAERNNTLKTSQLLVGLIVKYKVEDVTGEALVSGQARDQSMLVVDPNLQVTKQQALANAAERLSSNLASELSEGW